MYPLLVLAFYIHPVVFPESQTFPILSNPTTKEPDEGEGGWGASASLDTGAGRMGASTSPLSLSFMSISSVGVGILGPAFALLSSAFKGDADVFVLSCQCAATAKIIKALTLMTWNFFYRRWKNPSAQIFDERSRGWADYLC